MTAQEFWTNFEKQIENYRPELERCWDSKCEKSGETEFTKAIKQAIKRALTEAVKENFERVIDKGNKKIIPHGTYVLQNEYYRIDLIGWEQKKREKYYSVDDGIEGYRLNNHAWDFDIAIEHENDSSDWSDEVIKLAHIFCDLRVVIGYFPFAENDEKKKEKQLTYLKEVSETIKTLKCRENMKHGKFMIILGDVALKGAKGFEKLKYTPYLYNIETEEFEPLK